MRLSLGEVRIMCQRAAAGAGLPFGLAEDCADAAAWLVTAGLHGVEVFHRGLAGFLRGDCVAVRRGGSEGSDWRLEPAEGGANASSLFAGPALTDRVVLQAVGRGTARLGVVAVDEPLMVVACVAVAARRAPDPLTIRWGERGVGRRVEAKYVDGGWSLWGWNVAALEASGPVDLSVEVGGQDQDSDLSCLVRADDLEAAAIRCYEQGATIADETYEWVNARARRMLVPDNPRSRLAGAGAGLRDND